MSVVFGQNDPPRYNPRQDPKIQQLAESHGRQMEFLHNRNRELERQREGTFSKSFLLAASST